MCIRDSYKAKVREVREKKEEIEAQLNKKIEMCIRDRYSSRLGEKGLYCKPMGLRSEQN